MKVVEGRLAGVLVIEPTIHADDRGWFKETWREARYRDRAIPGPWVQDNVSSSGAGVLRGLHFQNPTPQAKLVTVLAGEALDVVVDLRRESPTFGRHEAFLLSGENHRQLYVPVGFAHGFLARRDGTLLLYKVSAPYDPAGDRSLRWDDPALGIAWGIEAPRISPKDAAAPLLAELPEAALRWA